MRVLFISKDNPYGVGGGNFATHAYMRAFSDISCGNMDVFFADYINEDGSIAISNVFKVPERSLFDKLCSVFTGVMHRNVKAVLRHLHDDNKYDLCVFNNSKTSAGLINVVKSYGIKTVTIHHNCEVEYFVDNTPNFLFRSLFCHHVKKCEKKSYKLSDYNLFLTLQDMKSFKQMYGDNQKHSFLLGTFEFKDLPQIIDYKNNNDRFTFAITGSLCTEQGVDGINYFFEKLYDLLPVEADVIISGRSPSAEIIEKCNSRQNVTLVPNPSDMNEVIRKADVYICPTRKGGGLKLRVMDALRLGIPVISHTCSARGYDMFVEENYLIPFSCGEEFLDGINYLMKCKKEGSINRNTIRKKYEEVFSYNSGLARLKKIIT